MKDLLLKWIELETESRCRLNDGCIEFRIGDERLIQVYVDPLEDYPPEVFACVQLAVQEAIKAKNWDFLMESSRFAVTPGNYETRYETSVIVPAANGEDSFFGVSDIAAESLLSAYLKALEVDEMGETA